MIDLIGYTGSLLLALCGAPLAYHAFVNGHARGISLLFLLMWLDGEILTMVYVFTKHNGDAPLVFNYMANIILIFIVLYYKLFPRN